MVFSLQDIDSDDWVRLVLTSVSAMVLYFLITNVVPLYPLNNLSDSPTSSLLTSTLVGVVPFTLVMLAFYFRHRLGMLLGVIVAYLWLAAQLATWWIPYLFGPTPEWYLEHGYDETITILPTLGNRAIVPDLQHLILESLSLVVAIVTMLAYLHFRRQADGSTKIDG